MKSWTYSLTVRVLFCIAASYGYSGVITSDAVAQSLCSLSTAPTNFTVDSIRVRLEDESEFHEIDSTNFCYAPQDFTLGGGSADKIYIVDLATTVTSLTPDYPAGTEFEISITNHDPEYKLGAVDAKAAGVRVAYGDEHGGSSDHVTAVVTTHDIFRPSTVTSGIPYCANVLDDQKSKGTLYLWAYKASDKVVTTIRQRMIQSESVITEAFPDIRFEPTTLEFQYGYALTQCKQEGKDYDSFVHTFFPNSTLAKAGLSASILAALNDTMLPLLFQTSSDPGMQVTSLTVMKSYGEVQSLDGMPTSTTSTGLIFDLKAVNTGASYSSARIQSESHTISPFTRKGGFRIKAAAQKQIKDCTSKKKMKKGRYFKKVGTKVLCLKRKT